MPLLCKHQIEALEGRRLLSVVPAGFTESQFAAGLDRPTAMAFAPDGRLFICEQAGRLRVVEDGSLRPDPILSLPADDRGERGLLGVTFDPAFSTNGRFYVYWTTAAPTTHNRVSRFTLTDPASNAVAPASERTILDLPTLSNATNHNGGAIHFGADGKLYVGVGENGNANNSQSLDTPLGKILRINANGSMPADNPFIARTSGINQSIWAMGLRNPYTFAVQPGSGRIFINDVGQGAFEEVDEGRPGANFGWPTTEGPTDRPQVDAPFHAYDRRNDGLGSCAITGGAFYNPTSPNFPAEYEGDYFFADFCGGYIQSIESSAGARPTASMFAAGLAGPVDLRTGPDGGLYALNHANGTVTRFASDGSAVGEPAGADLAATIEHNFAGLVVGGDRGRAVIHITNAGTDRVKGRTAIRLFLSTDGLLDQADAPAADFTTRINLKPGKEKTLRRKITLPDTLDGQYVLLANVDAPASFEEAEPANNVAVSTPFLYRAPVVDLTAAFMTPTPDPVPLGKHQRIRLTVLNVGNVRARGRATLTLYAATDSTGAGGAIEIGRAAKPLRLNPGAAKPYSIRFRLPSDLPNSGHYFSAAIDSTNAIEESDEANNFTVADMPFQIR